MTEPTETTQATDAVAPLSDEVHEVADRIVRRYPVARSALLPLLHLVQSEQNHITDEGVAFCAEKVGLTRAEVGAVATFYTMYKRQPVGDWLLSVCTNPPCKIAGGQEIHDNYVEALGGRHSDPETRVTVEHAECLGICDGAPVVQVNYEMFGPMTVEEGSQLLDACRRGDPPASPWSGEKPPTFAEVHRDLSGANDAWEAELHRAALQQVAHDVPPTYRTGETDIPVTHPGGDPAGIGGVIFRQQASGDGPDAAEAEAQDLAPTADVVADRDPAEGDPDRALAGDDSQRIAPGESDDESISAYGGGHPTADEVDVHPPRAEATGGMVPEDATALTRGPGPGDQPGHVGVLGQEGDTARVTSPTTPDAESEGYADDPDQTGETASGAADDTEDTEGRAPSDATAVSPGESRAPAESSGVGSPEGEPEAEGFGGVLGEDDLGGATEPGSDDDEDEERDLDDVEDAHEVQDAEDDEERN